MFTAEDFRFTVKGDSLYAICLHYPEDGRVTVKALGEQDASHLPKFHGIIKRVEVLGFEEQPKWKRDGEGLHMETESVRSDKPVAFKITLE